VFNRIDLNFILLNFNSLILHWVNIYRISCFHNTPQENKSPTTVVLQLFRDTQELIIHLLADVGGKPEKEQAKNTQHNGLETSMLLEITNLKFLSFQMR
jgi:hypothetical protein